MAISIIAAFCQMPVSLSQVPEAAVQDWLSMDKELAVFQCETEYLVPAKGNISDRKIATYQAVRGVLAKVERDEATVAILKREDGRTFQLEKFGAAWQRTNTYSNVGDAPAIHNASRIVRMGFSVHGSLTLLEMMDDKLYKVTNWKTSMRGRNLIDFTVTTTKPREIFTSAIVTIDPSNRHRVVALEFNSPQTSADSAIWEHEYGDTGGLTQIVPNVWRLVGGGKYKETKMTYINDHAPPAEEFTLAHYGIGEYTRTRNIGWRLLVLLLSGVVLIVLLFARRPRVGQPNE